MYCQKWRTGPCRAACICNHALVWQHCVGTEVRSYFIAQALAATCVELNGQGMAASGPHSRAVLDLVELDSL